jgi:hypothetical protein
MRRARHCSEGRGVYRVLVGKPEGKGPLGRSRHRWEYHNEMDIQEVGCGGMDWIGLAQDGDMGAGTCECGNEPSGFIKFGNFLVSCKPVSFSRRNVLDGVSK